MIRSIEKLDQEKSFIERIRSLVESDWQEINQEIQLQLDTDVGLISNISNYIINSGGKRLRPLMVLLVAKACDADDKNYARILAAIMIELIHTATLLHDDVVDDSKNRRGRETVHQHFAINRPYWWEISYIPEPFKSWSKLDKCESWKLWQMPPTPLLKERFYS